MPTTRKQASIQEAHENEKKNVDATQQEAEAGHKRDAEEVKEEMNEVPTKRIKTDSEPEEKGKEFKPQTGTVERGHIYFFYRPKVQMEEASSLEDVKNFHMVLVPRPPEFSAYIRKPNESMEGNEDAEMKLLSAGADAVPAPAIQDESKQHYRLVTIGKKHLPDPDAGGKGRGRKQIFWADVTSVGDDLHSLEKGLGEKEYETKTRGTRHNEPARLVARGAYAFVNNDPRVPSQRTTHFGYYISHPATLGDVQKDLGISKSSSFVVQIKNPLAPPMNPQQAHTKGAKYPQWIMRDVFGTGSGEGSKRRAVYGLRFTSCETPELLDHVGTQLLLIAAREGVEGLETSLGEGRGKALEEAEEKESDEAVEDVFRELCLDLEVFPAEPLKGNWI